MVYWGLSLRTSTLAHIKYLKLDYFAKRARCGSAETWPPKHQQIEDPSPRLSMPNVLKTVENRQHSVEHFVFKFSQWIAYLKYVTNIKKMKIFTFHI